jgi:hypothetical protein
LDHPRVPPDLPCDPTHKKSPFSLCSFSCMSMREGGGFSILFIYFVRRHPAAALSF